jgi:hypothetical protein
MADRYVVTGQRQTVELDASGRALAGVEITFTTKPSNVVSAITVPAPQYTPDEVARLLDEAAANVEAIHAL